MSKDDAVQAMFGALTTEDPGVKAVLALVRQRKREVHETVLTAPGKVTEAERTYYAGLEAGLEDLGADIQERMGRGRTLSAPKVKEMETAAVPRKKRGWFGLWG